MTTITKSNPNEPALGYFTPDECSTIPSDLWTEDPSDHRARNWLLGQVPKVISRSLGTIKDPDFQAPDGSLFRLLSYGKDGQIAHVIFPSRMVANAVMHPRVTEQWYCYEGTGVLWLANSETSDIKKINFVASSCLTIPARTAFRFINTAEAPLKCVVATSPLWATLQDGTSGEALLPMDTLAQLESQTPKQETVKSQEEAHSFALGGKLRFLAPTELTDRIQMALWELPPHTTTKVFRATSGTQSYYVLSGKGKCTYSVPYPQANDTVFLEEGSAITCPSSAVRQIQTHNNPLTILLTSQPKGLAFEETS